MLLIDVSCNTISRGQSLGARVRHPPAPGTTDTPLGPLQAKATSRSKLLFDENLAARLVHDVDDCYPASAHLETRSTDGPS